MTRQPLLIARGWLRASCVAAVFAAAFGGSCWLAARWLPFPEVASGVVRKRAHLAAHGNDYDAIFLGSSRVELQIMPAIFDQRMAELGLPIHSFNAGVSAMTPPEDAFLFDQIRRGPHGRLRWVFIELDYPRLKAHPKLWESGRLAYWHDTERMQIMWHCFLAEWTRTQAALAKKSQRKKPWSARLETRLGVVASLLEHVSGFLQNQANLGRGAGLASALVKNKKSRPAPPDEMAADQGWVRLAGGLAEKDRAPYAEACAARLVSPQKPAPDEPAGAEALRRLVKKVTASGATPVLLVSPTTRRTQFLPPADLRQSPVLDFSDVRAFPELFLPSHRLDAEHLNADGAPFYSRLLAERFFASLPPAQNPRP